MSEFQYHNGELHAEGVALSEIARLYSTPTYIYSRAAIENSWHAYDRSLSTRKHLVCYAVKANSNLAVLNLLARLGSGFDIVSVGELERVLRAGGDPSRVVFSGAGKSRAEMARALDVNIRCFNVESLPELLRLDQVAAEMNRKAPVSLRINPDVDAKTHPYISTGLRENKFGIPIEDAVAVYERAGDLENIIVQGIDCHIGSQITTLAPYTDALARIMELVGALKQKKIVLQHIDAGGGLGIQYRQESPPTPEQLGQEICRAVDDDGLELLIEPGRSIVGNAAVLLSRVEYIKDNGDRNFAIVDAAMNDMLRPALYDAWLDILPVREAGEMAGLEYDIVGPVCESADFLGLERQLSLQEGDLLAVCSAGAYGFSMSSNYNSRPRAAEIMVDGELVTEIRQRESIDALMQGERTIPEAGS